MNNRRNTSQNSNRAMSSSETGTFSRLDSVAILLNLEFPETIFGNSKLHSKYVPNRGVLVNSNFIEI